MNSFQFLIMVIFSPLLQGVIKKLKANMQGRVGPSVIQPYFDIYRLFKKEMVLSSVASWIFRAAPYIVFISAVTAAMLVPVITTKTIFSEKSDIIVLIYLFALGRFFMALAGLDAGTAFGGEGSSREMTVAILVEPTVIFSVFTAAIASGSTNLSRIVEAPAFLYTPSHALAAGAFLVAIVAETGRIPVDNPDTHLELTMIHEGMLLEYSGRYLALMEWSYCIRQMLLFTVALDIFFPLGLDCANHAYPLFLSFVLYCVKISVIAGLIAGIESTRAKMRFFQLPSLLGGAFILSFLSLVTFMITGR